MDENLNLTTLYPIIESRYTVMELPKRKAYLRNGTASFYLEFKGQREILYETFVVLKDFIADFEALQVALGDKLRIEGVERKSGKIVVLTVEVLQRTPFRKNYNKPLVYFDKWE